MKIQSQPTKTTIIKTECVFPPIQIRALDWEATKDEYEAGDPIGRGSTEKRAIKDLAEQCADITGCCETCGEDDFSPNTEAFEISGKIVCDECAAEIFEENSQFGVGA